jgi:hypothetical protein
MPAWGQVAAGELEPERPERLDEGAQPTLAALEELQRRTRQAASTGQGLLGVAAQRSRPRTVVEAKARFAP